MYRRKKNDLKVYASILVGILISLPLMFTSIMDEGKGDKPQAIQQSQALTLQEQVNEPQEGPIPTASSFIFNNAMQYNTTSVVLEDKDIGNTIKQTNEQDRQQSFVSTQEVNTEPEESNQIANIEKQEEIQATNSEVQEINQEEFETRCKLTYAESGNQDYEGQVAVAAVILNRQASENFPDTFEGVMTQKGAFSSVKNGNVYIMTSKPYVIEYEKIPEKTIKATQDALNGYDPTEELLWQEAVRLGLDPEKYAEGGALFFYNPKYCSESALMERNSIKCKVQIGDHIFYKVWDQ